VRASSSYATLAGTTSPEASLSRNVVAFTDVGSSDVENVAFTVVASGTPVASAVGVRVVTPGVCAA
jgi:hypothetical protein